MSELTTIARPYAKAAFDFAIEQSAVEKWTEMLGFAAAVAEDETVKAYLSSSLSAQKLADTVISICGEQLDQYGQNLIRLMAEISYSGISWYYTAGLPSQKAEEHFVKEMNNLGFKDPKLI